MGSPPPVTRAYTDTELVAGLLGQQYFNLVSAVNRVCASLPCGWVNATGTGGNPAGPNGCLQVQSGGAFACSFQAATAAIKPQASDNICYVSQNGNDSNDGFSVGSAKLTVYACLQALPGGSSTTAGNGTILISGSVNYGGPVSRQGMWLMGAIDPNYASPPAGWLKFTGSPAITIDCLSTNLPAASGHTGHCGLGAGNWTTPGPYPAIWISGEAGNLTLKNFQITNFANTYIRYSIDSNNNRNGTGGSSGLKLENLSFANGACTGSTQTGPSIDIGSNSFWIWMYENVIGGCEAKNFSVASSGAVRSSGVTTITTTATNDVSTNEMVTITNVTDDSFNGSFFVTVIDGTHFTYTNPGPNTTSGTGQVVTARSAAINIDSGPTGTGTGLVFITDTNLNEGNIRYKGGTNGGGFYVKNLSTEGTAGQIDGPAVLVTGTSATANCDGTIIHIENVQTSDSFVPIPSVQVDNGTNCPDLVLVSSIQGAVRGRMTVLSGTGIETNPPSNSSYLRRQQFGIRQGQLVATGVDVARRGFSPVSALGTNIAATSPASWTISVGTGTITSGISAPDRTTGAGRVVGITGVPGTDVQFYSSSAALNLGDTYIGGAWVRSATANGYNSGNPPIGFSFGGGGAGVGDTCASAPGVPPSGNGIIFGNVSGPMQADGQWQFYSLVCKVFSNPTTPGTTFFGVADSTHTVDIYAPILVLFPAGTISDNEAYEIAANLSPWPSSANPGDLSTLPSQPVKIPGSLTVTGALNANGGLNSTGLTQLKNLEGVQVVDNVNSQGWSGADACAWITSAQTALPSGGGSIIAYGLNQTCAGGFTIGSGTKPVSLYLLSLTNLTVNAQLIVGGQSSHIYGVTGPSGVASGQTTILQGGSFPASTAVILIGPTSIITLSTVEGILVNCQNATNSIAFEDLFGEDQSGFSGDVAQNFTKYGFWYEGGGGNSNIQNAIANNLWSLSSTSGSTANGFYFHNGNLTRGDGLTAVSNGAVAQAAQIVIDGGSFIFGKLHAEQGTIGVDIGPVANTIVELDGVTGAASVPTMVKIENVAGTRVILRNLIANGSTNTINDSLNSSVGNITDSYIHDYFVVQAAGNVPGALYHRADDRDTRVNVDLRALNTAGTVDFRAGAGTFSGSTRGELGTFNSQPVGIFTNNILAAAWDVNQNLIENQAVRAKQAIADQGTACTNGELALSAGWQSTGAATATAVAGNGQTCSWTITTGTTTAANPTVTDMLTNALPAATTVCELNIHGGTHTAAAGEGFTQTTLSATAPIFTFIGTPTAGGTTYFVTRRCGP